MRFIDIDKQGHFWAGWAICLTSALVFGSILFGVVVGVVAGVIREVTGNRDMGDFLATVLGVCIGALIWMWATP